jgi:hypothetical protein
MIESFAAPDFAEGVASVSECGAPAFAPFSQPTISVAATHIRGNNVATSISSILSNVSRIWTIWTIWTPLDVSTLFVQG